MRTEARIVRLQARIDKLYRTERSVLERSRRTLNRVPEFQREIEQCEQAVRSRLSSPIAAGAESDFTGTQTQRIEILGIIPGETGRLVRQIRMLRAKVASTQRVGRRLEEAAAKKAREAAVIQAEVTRLMRFSGGSSG